MKATAVMVAGVDPGLKGAMVGIGLYERVVNATPMPVLAGSLHEQGVREWFVEYRPAWVVIEQVNSFGMGRQSAFNFGMGVGQLRGICSALQIPYILVYPKTWQKGIPGQGAKTGEALKQVWQAEAQRRAPELFANYKFNKAHRSAVADAYLMACWQSRKLGAGVPPHLQAKPVRKVTRV